MFVLIVKEDQDIITKCTHGIKACVQSVRPHVNIQHRSLGDHSADRFKNKCEKVIFLLSNNNESTKTAQKEWICNLPKIRNNKSKFTIIKLKKSNESEEEADEDSEIDEDNVTQISNFENDIFQWWPKVLVFLFGKRSVGRLFNTDTIQSRHRFCLHCFPNRAEIAHPITREILDMLQAFGACKVDHGEEKQLCILLCKDASMHLPHSIQSELVNKAKDVHVLGVALTGTNFSDEIVTHTDRCFTRNKLMSLILVLLTELSLIDAKTRHQPTARHRPNLHVPSLLLYFAAHMVFTFNLPALLIQLAAAMIFPWPVMVLCSVHDDLEKVKLVNLGFAGSSIAVIVVLIVSESVLFPEFFPFPISVPVSIYLLVWQIGFGLKLCGQHDFKYGIYSIPSKILNMA